MELIREVCYRALLTRDPRFDGRFFTAVRSTGIYCRPICPAPTPRLEHCTFVQTAAAAQEQGYRPCRRCRPEASPGTPTWLGTSAVVSRALRLISDGALDAGSVEDLAARLGVGERHLRRLFDGHLGASPTAVARTRRLLFAKKLIDETRLPMSQVALAAGFSSIRRFNDAVKRTYDLAPRDLRRASGCVSSGSGLELKLTFRPPLHWDALVRYLAIRATPGAETVSPDAYRRTVRVEGRPGWFEVRPVDGANHLVARLHLGSPTTLMRVAERIQRIFDLGADPTEIARHLSGDPRLGPAVERLPGLRVPGAWDAFELAVRAILGQQVTVRGATTLMGRLVEACGEELEPSEDRPRDLAWLFPEPHVLAEADLTRVGLPRARAAAIGTLSRAVAHGDLLLDASSGLDEIVLGLKQLPGVGEWTAQYVALRALREPDAFPASDLGLRKAAANGATRHVSPSALERISRAWRPWRAYAAMYLWMSDAALAGQARRAR